MSNHNEQMKSFNVITKFAQNIENSYFNHYHGFKVSKHLRDKYRNNLQKLQQQCCQLYSTKSDFDNEVKATEQTKIRVLNLSESIKAANIEFDNKLLLIKNENEHMDKRISNDSIKCDNKWVENKKNFECLPHHRSLKVAKNEMEQLKDSINNLELKAVTLREEISKKKAEIWITDRDFIIKFAKYVVIELPAQKKKYRETIAFNKRSSYNDSLTFKIPTNDMNFWRAKFTELKSDAVDKNKLLEPATPYKFKANVKKVQLKDWTKVDEKEIIDKIMAENNSKKKLLADILEENNTNQPAFSYDNITKRKRLSSSYVDDKEKSKESISQNQDCPKEKVINILEDVKVDKECTNSLLSGVNINDLKETNKISAKFHANTVADAVNTNDMVEGEEELEVLDITGSQNSLIPPTQYRDYNENKNSKKVSFKIAAEKPSESEVADVDEQMEDSSQSQADESFESMGSVFNSLYKFYALDDKKSIYFPKKKTNESNKFRRDELEDYEMKDEKNVAKEGGSYACSNKDEMEIAMNINERNGASATPDFIGNKKTVDIPEQDNQGEKPEKDISQLAHNDMDVTSNTAAGEDLDLPNIDTSLFLSPKADLVSIMDEDKGISQGVTGFLTSLRKKNAMSFFGQTSTQESGSDNPKEEECFNFNFGREDKKTKSGFFSMF